MIHPGELHPYLTSIEKKFKNPEALRVMLGDNRPIMVDAPDHSFSDLEAAKGRERTEPRAVQEYTKVFKIQQTRGFRPLSM